MKKEIILRFPSVKDLWLFWNELACHPSHVSLHTKMITYQLTDEEVNLAISKYKAQVVDSTEVPQK